MSVLEFTSPGVGIEVTQLPTSPVPISLLEPALLRVLEVILERMQAAPPSLLPHSLRAKREDPGVVIMVSFVNNIFLPAAETTLDADPRIKLTDNVLQPMSQYPERLAVIVSIVRLFQEFDLDEFKVTVLPL